MSTDSQEQDVQGKEQGHSAGFVTTMRNHLINPIPEILVLILCNYTLNQLINFWCSCRQFNFFVLFHQSTIVREVLGKASYRTATATYHGLVLPRQLKFSNLVDMTRRCSIARDIAHFLTQDRLVASGFLRYDSPSARKRAVYPTARVAKNAYPYLLALQFFDEYRFRLASSVLDPNALLGPSSQVEVLVMAKYDHETVVRLCAMYRVLQKLLYRKVPHPEREYLEFFILGGLEAFKEIICACGWKFYTIMDYYSGGMPIQFPVTGNGRSPAGFPRPRSVLLPFDEAIGVPTSMIRRFIPKVAEMLNLDLLHKDPDIEQAAFLQWLMTYDGEEPRLLRRKED